MESIAKAKKHISLLGLMGCGKSTIGERLARALQWPFIDLDVRIASTHGPISALFQTLGEAGFRQLEEAALAEALTEKPSVLSPGGGAVTHAASRLRLAQTTRVYLEVPLKTLLRRLSHSSNIRPLLGANPTFERIAELHRARKNWYEEADITINGNAPVDRVVSAIMQALERSEAPHMSPEPC